MIIVKLMGGIGNQMFQYAAGRRLSVVHRAPLKLDLTWFADMPDGDTPRKFLISLFPISASIASPAEIAAVKESRTRKGWRRLFSPIPWNNRLRIIEEKNSAFDPSVLRLSGDLCLCGYWQDERYFADIEKLLRQEFVFRPMENVYGSKLINKLTSSESVAVHVRRGDYLTSPHTSARHGVCSLEYYHAAMETVANHFDSPHFFIFSDDMPWVKENLSSSIYSRTYVDHNGPDMAYEDLRLMSMCRHQIIANSSFSWWAAWLNCNDKKLVIAPARWYANGSKDLPDKWILL